MDEIDRKMFYETLIEILMIGVVGIYITMWDKIFLFSKNISTKIIFSFLAVEVVFTLSLISKRLFIYRRSILKIVKNSFIICIILILLLFLSLL